MILPAVSLLVGVAISKLSDLLTGRMIVARFVPLFLLGMTLSLPILWENKFFFGVSPVEACRMLYSDNPFAESVKIADYLREHTGPDDTIAVLGSEPEIYFYSQRHSATGYIYTYGLMEPQKYAGQMQEEMIHEIERARPKYLISVVMFYSWLWRPASDRLIFTWANEYTAQNYTAAGLVNMTAKETDYFFGDVPPSVDSLKKLYLDLQTESLSRLFSQHFTPHVHRINSQLTTFLINLRRVIVCVSIFLAVLTWIVFGQTL